MQTCGSVRKRLEIDGEITVHAITVVRMTDFIESVRFPGVFVHRGTVGML